MNRGNRLTAFIRSFDRKPVTWGEDDCCMFAARWVEQELGDTLGLPEYKTEAHARALMADGLGKIWYEISSSAGLWRTSIPELGDVGLIRVRTGLVGCIIAHGGVAVFRTNTGTAWMTPRTFELLISVPELP